MIKYWINLSKREKQLVSIALAISTVFLLWQFALKPLLAYPAKQQKIYQKTQSNLRIMQDGQSVLANIAPVEKSKLPVSDIFAQVTKSAGEHGLIISRRQPNGNTGISLWFAKVQAPQFYHWLDDLTKKHDVTILRASINRNDGGTIQAQITFKLGS